MPLLSVIIPVYNEEKTIAQIVDTVNLIDIDKEIIVVNDGSLDGTSAILNNLKYNNLKIVHHTTNRGKGAAFLTGLSNASGEFVIIQDADLEYDPHDYLKLINVIKEDKADLVLGARFTEGYHGLFMHKLGNRFLTGFLNIMFNVRLNDYFTCYKLFRRDTLNAFDIISQGFDLETELIAKALNHRLRILEIPISYHPRTYSAGKKIRWYDAMVAIINIVKWRFKRIE